MRRFTPYALIFLCLISAAIGLAQQPITWTTQSVVLESDFSSWTRMVKLKDGSWLAVYMVTTSPNQRVRIKRSFDRMRTWQFVSEIGETGRHLDNPTLGVLPDGTVLLGVRSEITGQSYWIETYRSIDNGNSFQYQSQVDWDRHAGGVYEPYLYVLPSGDVACFYTSEVYRYDTPSYSQVLSEKVSPDGGFTWGPEIIAISQPGAARPGEANIVALPGSVLALFFEMCGSENCIGHVSYSTDGVTWPGIGPALPDTFEDSQAVGLDNGVIVVTSNLKSIIISDDYTGSWIVTHQHPFVYGAWPGLYQTGPNEIAMVMTGAGEHGETGEYIRFGTIDFAAIGSSSAASTCRRPTGARPQSCF